MRTFVQNLITFCSQTEAVGDVISSTFVGPVVLDKRVKFHDTSLNHSREIPPEAVSIFDCFPFQLEVNNDVTSDAVCPYKIW